MAVGRCHWMRSLARLTNHLSQGCDLEIEGHGRLLYIYELVLSASLDPLTLLTSLLVAQMTLLRSGEGKDTPKTLLISSCILYVTLYLLFSDLQHIKTCKTMCARKINVKGRYPAWASSFPLAMAMSSPLLDFRCPALNVITLGSHGYVHCDIVHSFCPHHKFRITHSTRIGAGFRR